MITPELPSQTTVSLIVLVSFIIASITNTVRYFMGIWALVYIGYKLLIWYQTGTIVMFSMVDAGLLLFSGLMLHSCIQLFSAIDNFIDKYKDKKNE